MRTLALLNESIAAESDGVNGKVIQGLFPACVNKQTLLKVMERVWLWLDVSKHIVQKKNHGLTLLLFC